MMMSLSEEPRRQEEGPHEPAQPRGDPEAARPRAVPGVPHLPGYHAEAALQVIMELILKTKSLTLELTHSRPKSGCPNILFRLTKTEIECVKLVVKIVISFSVIDLDVDRTRDPQIWNLMHYHCATKSADTFRFSSIYIVQYSHMLLSCCLKMSANWHAS